MSYLLDTNACIKLLNNSSPRVSQRLASVNQSDVCLCSIVIFELYFGAYKSQQQLSNLALISAFSARFVSLPFDDDAATIAGRERARLAKLGTPIGSSDLLIAAIALTNQATLVTHNTSEFSRIANLPIEDWEV